MKKIEAFQTEDGRVFEKEEDALEAELEGSVNALYRKWAEDNDERTYISQVAAFVTEKRKELLQLLQKPTRMYVILEGGIVSGILSDAPVECIVKDYDYDEEDKNCTDSDGNKYNGYEGICYVEKDLVDKTFKEVNG